jgi:hypothetical protein
MTYNCTCVCGVLVFDFLDMEWIWHPSQEFPYSNLYVNNYYIYNYVIYIANNIYIFINLSWLMKNDHEKNYMNL